MKKRLAFALAGGGARGALQVGAMRALLEANIRPDLLVGTSIGAVNAALLALYGADTDGIKEVIKVWLKAADADLLPANYLWFTVRFLFKRPGETTSARLVDFLKNSGLHPNLRFGDLQGPPVIIVATDLNSGKPVLYGTDPQQPVLEAVMASAALPPWVSPIQKNQYLYMDGGVVSNLPIEPALQQGVSEIIALSLDDPRDPPAEAQGFGAMLGRVVNAVSLRQLELETALAAACDVPVRLLALHSQEPVPIWDFSKSDELIIQGYELANQEIGHWKIDPPPAGLARLNPFRKKG